MGRIEVADEFVDHEDIAHRLIVAQLATEGVLLIDLLTMILVFLTEEIRLDGAVFTATGPRSHLATANVADR